MKRIASNPLRRLLPMLSGPVVLALAIVVCGPLAAAQDGIQFLDPLNDEPLDIALPEDASDAVRRFHQTGENPYEGDEQAIAAGEQIYKRWCQACHLPDGSGRIGPSIVDDTWKYERTGTDKGKFEIIHAGGAGAMQAFGQRLSQDEILEVIAYLNELDRQHP